MEQYNQNYYLDRLNTNEETSKIFDFFPMFFKNKKESITFYSSSIILSSITEVVIGTYFIIPVLTLLLIMEHRRIMIARECILDLCISDEIIFESELKESEDFLQEINESTSVIDFDRNCIFFDNLAYCPSRSRTNYIKNHYSFYSPIVAIYTLLLVIKILL
jgi:hypothetical protein